MFVVEKKIHIYIMSTCFGREIQTVYSCLNRTENRQQKLKPNRTEKNLNRGSPSVQYIYIVLQSSTTHLSFHSDLI